MHPRDDSKRTRIPSVIWAGVYGSRRFDMGDLFPLAYLIFFLLEPIARHSAHYWLECLPLLAGFLALWFSFIYARSVLVKRCIVVAVALLGTATMPLNEGGGTCFLIYTISLLPYCIVQLPWQLGTMGTMLLVIYGEERWRHFPPSALFFTLFFAMVGGGANLFFAEKERNNCRLQRKQEEIEALAAVAERERIARDLHDVLGHTLSVIVLKSELAHRLLGRELASLPASAASQTLVSRPEAQSAAAEKPASASAPLQPTSTDRATLHRVCAEIADVERTARTALAEVREAIGGYRARGLGAELDAARETLATAGVTLATEGDLHPATLTAAEETVLALALREAVTNIVRHAAATTCTVRLVAEHGHHRLSIQDNGHHSATGEGNGLRGMRERVESLGGQLFLNRTAGTHLLIELPLRPSLP